MVNLKRLKHGIPTPTVFWRPAALSRTVLRIWGLIQGISGRVRPILGSTSIHLAPIYEAPPVRSKPPAVLRLCFNMR